jgi:hypothetical protein
MTRGALAFGLAPVRNSASGKVVLSAARRSARALKAAKWTPAASSAARCVALHGCRPSSAAASIVPSLSPPDDQSDWRPPGQ